MEKLYAFISSTHFSIRSLLHFSLLSWFSNEYHWNNQRTLSLWHTPSCIWKPQRDPQLRLNRLRGTRFRIAHSLYSVNCLVIDLFCVKYFEILDLILLMTETLYFNGHLRPVSEWGARGVNFGVFVERRRRGVRVARRAWVFVKMWCDGVWASKTEENGDWVQKSSYIHIWKI